MSGDPATETVALDEGEPAVGDPAVRVLGWRLERLVAAGYDGEAALALALDHLVDLHEAVRLVARGCPPETAFRILT